MAKQPDQKMECACGKKFKSERELSEHGQTCPMAKGQQGGKTKTAR